MLDVHQLNVFLVAAETLSFTQAAARLHMTQPSVSQHIQALERRFEAPLFLRSGRSLELTDAGLALLPLAREAVALSIRIDETMESLKGNIYGHLIVACSTTPGKYILPQVLARFHRSHPQVSVTCNVMPQSNALESIASGESHFGLFSIVEATPLEIESLPYICDPIVLIAPLDHPWARKQEITPEELLEGDFIQRELSSGTQQAVREALARCGISINDLHVVITLGNAEAIALAVQEGIGVAFISQMVVDRICPSQVATVRVAGLDICRQIYIGRSSRRPSTGAQAAFWNFLTVGAALGE